MQRLKSKKSILWIAYGLCTLLLLVMQTGFFNRFTFKGAGPLIIPVCVGIVAVYEGGVPAAVFGICCGFCLDSLSSGSIWAYTFFLAAAGWCVGETASYTSRGALLSCIVWSFAVLVTIAVCEVVYYGILGGALNVSVRLAVVQTLYSLLFSIPLCYIFRIIHRRFGND